ncbi:MAG TPA: lysine--tRNA ligase [Acidobacteria bacterium]|nr:lysine--tRNA ligase [Acidobacteriota bacterium]
MSEGDLFEIRRQKLEAFEESGGEAFPRGFDVDAPLDAIAARFAGHDAEEFEAKGEKLRLAGRIVSSREHGKTSFANISDGSASIQLYVRKDDLGELIYAAWQNLDLGDYVGVEGVLMRTRSGELTLRIDSYTMLAKSLRPLPEKWHGLKDTEIRYRQRYLDLAVNDEVREVFHRRAQALRALRAHLDAHGFIEVETPIMQPQYGGALARPFTTHHNTLDLDLYLRVAPELYLKRLLVGGMGRVYELNRNFRNEGVSTQHNPEFTMLEFYVAYWDYRRMMEFVEELLALTVKAVLGAPDFEYQGNMVSMQRPWKRMKFADALMEIGGVPYDVLSDEDGFRTWLQEREVPAEDLNLDYMWDAALSRFVQPSLISPTFITHFPRDVSPFSKVTLDDENFVERFEIYWGGLETGNGYSELNDPREQRCRMEAMAHGQGKELSEQRVDEDYILALEYGMPPAAGFGVGIDRLMMLLTDSRSIRDVILFPLLKPKKAD